MGWYFAVLFSGDGLRDCGNDFIFTIGEYIFEVSTVESTINDSSLPDLKP
jgi:hypothetical protein